MMKEYNVEFEAWEVTEPDAGGMKSVHVAYFSSPLSANEFANQNNSWPRYVNKVTVNKRWVILDSVPEYEDYTTKVKKQIALNKLTAEERKLLGY